MIDGIFIPQEAELIKRIPLSRFEANDSIFWPLSQNGQYSCKLGYRFLREKVDFNRLEEPPDYEKGLWKVVWNLDSPNKVKHLIWKACKNSLPTKGNLVCWQIILTTPVIDVQEEGKTFYMQFRVVLTWMVFGVQWIYGGFRLILHSRALMS